MRLLVLLAFVAGLLIAAPLPRPKPRPPLTGTTWVMVHGSSTYWARFHADGRYMAGNCNSKRPLWAGTWRMDGDTLVVKEQMADVFGQPLPDAWILHWTAEVEPGAWQGTYYDSSGRTGIFRLQK